MSDKRFRLDTGCIIDQQENEVLSERQAVNRLNTLHEENQSYKQKVENTLLEFYKLYEGQIFWEIADELEFDLEKALKEDLE